MRSRRWALIGRRREDEEARYLALFIVVGLDIL